MLIRKALPKDIDAIKKIADSLSKELGFVIRGALVESAQRNELIVIDDNGVKGFVNFHRRKDGWTTIYEIAVSEKGKGYGQKLIDYLLAERHIIKLKCPVDNEANKFYNKVGKLVKIVKGKKRDLNVYIIIPEDIKVKTSGVCKGGS